MTNVIGLHGDAGVGKSVAADALEEAGFKRVRFSAPLKDMLCAFFRTSGLSEMAIERRIDGDLKEVPDVLLGGKTPRYAMQTLGTEWGRVLICEDIWSKAWTARARTELEAGHRIVAEDVRFGTESSVIHDLDGDVIELVGRSKNIVTAGHASERNTGVEVDVVIRNEGTIVELKSAVLRYVDTPSARKVA